MQQFNQQCYNFVNNTKTWAEAEAECNNQSWKGIQGHLAFIQTEEENSFVYGLSKSESVWLGGNDVQNEGTWSWTDGSPLTYINWHSGEPNNKDCKEHCLIQRSPLKWIDVVCDAKFKSVCKFTESK